MSAYQIEIHVSVNIINKVKPVINMMKNINKRMHSGYKFKKVETLM